MSADELDVDAELLALAGDDSSDDEGSDAGEVADHTPALDPRSPSEEPKPSVEKVEEQPPSARRGVAQRVKKRGGRKKVTRREIQDELEDLAE
jgi:RNA polymerase-associated protein RTF1